MPLQVGGADTLPNVTLRLAPGGRIEPWLNGDRVFVDGYLDIGAGNIATGTISGIGSAAAPGATLPVGLICMWSGLLVNVPAGWHLCDGTVGTPDLRGMFVKGALLGANPGLVGGAATHTHAAHVVTQPSAHDDTQPSAHAAHVFTQSVAHAAHVFTQAVAHVFTQPGAHSAHVVTQPGAHSAHVVTQPSAHSAHVVTQPSAHSNHAALGTHAHELPFTKLAGATGALRMLAGSIFGTGTSRAPESVSANPTANTTAAAVALSQAITAGTPDAHSAHVGSAVDAHSAHAGTAVDAHSAHAGTAVDAHSAHGGGAVDAHSGSGVDAHSAHSGAGVDAHSAHSGTAVDAHSGTAVDAHSGANSEPAYFSLAYIMKV